MTTKNIPQVPQATGHTRKLAEEFLKREPQVRQAKARLGEDRQMLAIGTAVQFQHLDDEEATHDEELSQHEAIRSRANMFLGAVSPAAPAPAAATPDTNVPPPATPVVVEQTPVPQPAPAPAPAPAPTQAQPAAQTTTRTTIVEHVRSWGFLEWALAFIGAVIGMIVASVTWDSLFGDINGVGRGILVVLWWIALILACFFIGGLIGSLIEGRRTVQETATTTTQTTTP